VAVGDPVSEDRVATGGVVFRAGVAYPLYCQLSAGGFVEPIEVGDALRLLAFRVTQNPPPMRELTFRNDIQATHAQGFLEA
jgi:hypothetical protein